jgi:uncharacterized protein (TIGR02444 family)
LHDKSPPASNTGTGIVDSNFAPDGPHWTFSLRVYGHAGVAELCVALQDRFGVDVNVLLLSLYAAMVRRVRIDAALIAELDGLAAAWRAEIVAPLRTIRRRLKSDPALVAWDDSGTVRTLVKDAELRAEQMEQAALAWWLESRAADRSTEDADAAAVVAAVVGHYRRQMGDDQPEETPQDPDISPILRAL